MANKFSVWRIAGAFGLPFVVASVFLILAEAMRNAWPSMLGETQLLGWVIGTIVGFLFIPRVSFVRSLVVGVPYSVGMACALFIFSLWFLGVVYGHSI
jgi:hypothetical protein